MHPARVVASALFFSACATASPALRRDDPEGERRVAELLADARARAVVTTPAPSACEPLPVEQWTTDASLQIHESTTCRYRITWLGWSPPRDYDYVPNAEGWIADYFIESAHGWVFWNLLTGEVVVRPVEGQPPLDEESARRVAGWAAATNFPGLDVTRTRLVPTIGNGPHP